MTVAYITLIIACLAIGGFATWWVNHQLKTYSKVPNSLNITGAQAVQQMLSYYGVTNIPVIAGSKGQDFFDPRNNTITLSPDSYNATTITAIATACHETGHAIQYAQSYTPMKVRGTLVPIVNLASNIWCILLILGIILNLAGLTTVAIVMFAAVVLFQLVTLPVEFNASHRALDYMKSIGLPQQDQSGSAKVLRACALTYVAAALISILQLLYLLGNTR